VINVRNPQNGLKIDIKLLKRRCRQNCIRQWLCDILRGQWWKYADSGIKVVSDDDYVSTSSGK